jgi:rhamnose transport system permease protein
MDRRRVISSLLPWLLLVLLAGVVASRLERPAAAWNLLRPWGEIGILALPMTAIILTGGIDLSVGSIVALASVVLGLAWKDLGWPIEAAALAAVLTGLTAGVANATLVTSGIPPLVATLATMAFYAGSAMALSGGQRVSGLPRGFAELGQGTWWGLPSQLWFLGVAALVAYLLVHHTRFGRYLYALGDNRLAATFAAVPVARLEWSLYAVSGWAAGCVALLFAAHGEAAVPNAGIGIELPVIACVVVGGTRVTGGYGGIGRTLLGIAVMALLDLALQLMGSVQVHLPWMERPLELTAHGRSVLVGVLVIAVAIWNQRLTERE